jgi:hypothetical protein
MTTPSIDGGNGLKASPVDSMLTIPAELHDAVMALSPEQRRAFRCRTTQCSDEEDCWVGQNVLTTRTLQPLVSLKRHGRSARPVEAFLRAMPAAPLN